MRVFLALCVAGCAWLCAPAMAAEDNEVADAWKLPLQKEQFHVFLLMGQSNMSGTAFALPEDAAAVPHVVKLPTVGELKWEPASHPLHNRLPTDRFGLGLPFAIEYLKDKPGVTVGLIPLAWGGMWIDGLNKGTPTYADAIQKALFARQAGVVKGVLWHQGESDTVNPARANSYEAKLQQLVSDLRTELEDDQLPFIVGNLAEFYGAAERRPDRLARINKVRAGLRATTNRVAHTGFVETTDCSSMDRHMVHFDRKSYIMLGKRYAEVYREIVE